MNKNLNNPYFKCNQIPLFVQKGRQVIEGPPGPRGPQGSQGQQGQQGPTGPAGFSGFNVLEAPLPAPQRSYFQIEPVTPYNDGGTIINFPDVLGVGRSNSIINNGENISTCKIGRDVIHLQGLLSTNSIVPNYTSILGGNGNTFTNFFSPNFLNYGSIVGGLSNQIIYNYNQNTDFDFIGICQESNINGSNYSTIISGKTNNITYGQYNMISSGLSNTIDNTNPLIPTTLPANKQFNIIVAGDLNENKLDNRTLQSSYKTILNGSSNKVYTHRSQIFNGVNNQIGDLTTSVTSSINELNTITNGINNNIKVNNLCSTIENGQSNTINGNSSYCSFINGKLNTCTNSIYTTISNGFLCTVSNSDTSFIHGLSNSINSNFGFNFGSYNTILPSCDSCFVGGTELTADKPYLTVFGRKNQNKTYTVSGVTRDPLFQVGKGTIGGAASNAFAIDTAGNVFSATGGIYVTGGADYGEYFEKAENEIIEIADIVYLDQGKIRKLKLDENNNVIDNNDNLINNFNLNTIIGVRSDSCGIVGNSPHAVCMCNESGSKKLVIKDYEPLTVDDSQEIEEKIYKENGDMIIRKKVIQIKRNVYETKKIFDENENQIGEFEAIKKDLTKPIYDYQEDISAIENCENQEIIGLIGQIKIKNIYQNFISENLPKWIKMKEINENISIYFVR